MSKGFCVDNTQNDKSKMAQKKRTICSTFLVVRQMQIKIIMKLYFIHKLGIIKILISSHDG